MDITEYLKEVTAQFIEAGIDTPQLDAEVLIAHALDLDRYKLIAYGENELSPDDYKRINKLIKRRTNREPVAYIIGQKEFYSLLFTINKNVLVPRPETELLVDLAIYYAPLNGVVLDIGTGSGAIAIAMQYNRRDCTVIGSDISENALKVAKKNAKQLLGDANITFIKSDVFETIGNRTFDVIVSNPPYIDRKDSDSLEKELSFEPEMALYSDDKGRSVVKKLIEKSDVYLNDNGVTIIEIGDDMKDFISDFGDKNGYNVSVLNDYSGLPRVAVLKRKK